LLKSIYRVAPFHNGIITQMTAQRRSAPWGAILLLAGLALAPLPVFSLSCTTSAQMAAADRDALIAAADPLAAAVAAQNFDLLQSSLVPAVIPDWDGIKSVAQNAKPVLQSGELHWRTAYLLDATELKGPSDAQFFCTNVDNSLTVTVNLRSLPPGRYGLMLGDYPGSPMAGQLALILGYDSKWKLGGLYIREGALNGHDSVWYWTQARETVKKNAANSWSAWFTYDTARWLAVPVDFLSSPNLEKLNREQGLLKSPLDSLPMTVNPTAAVDAGKSWRITALHIDTTLHTADLALTYDSTGLTDPVAARHEAVAVMSGLLHDHPELRESFHGLWAYAEKDGKQSYAIELAMHDIP
jgi:hypothetical protein